MWYFDSSAILEVMFKQKNSELISALLGDSIFTSRLTRVEVLRQIAKRGPHLREGCEEFFITCNLIEIERRFLKHAENYPPEITLKSSDAIHIATVECLQPLISGIVTLDKQMILNAKRLGIRVYEPAA